MGALALLGALVGTVAVRESLATECHRAVAEVVWEEAVAGATYEFVILEAGGRVLHNREATEGTACHSHFTELYEVYTPDQRRRLQTHYLVGKMASPPSDSVVASASSQCDLKELPPYAPCQHDLDCASYWCVKNSASSPQGMCFPRMDGSCDSAAHSPEFFRSSWAVLASVDTMVMWYLQVEFLSQFTCRTVLSELAATCPTAAGPWNIVTSSICCVGYTHIGTIACGDVQCPRSNSITWQTSNIELKNACFDITTAVQPCSLPVSVREVVLATNLNSTVWQCEPSSP